MKNSVKKQKRKHEKTVINIVYNNYNIYFFNTNNTTYLVLIKIQNICDFYNTFFVEQGILYDREM